ncbi:hypothetical protein ACHAWX_003034 [Stephanocyclus meneghinianus]
MPQSTPLTPADVSSPGSLASRYQTTLQLLSSTSRYTDEWFRLKEEEVALRNELAVGDTSFSVVPENNAELRISTDFHEEDRTVDPNERLANAPDEGHPISPLENDSDKDTKLESTLPVAINHEDDVAPTPIRQSSSLFVDDEVTRKMKVAGHNQKTHHVLAVKDSNTKRTLVDREIFEHADFLSSTRGDRNVLHTSAPNIRSTALLARTSASAPSQLAPNDAPSIPDTADPSRTLSESPSRLAPHQNDFEVEGEEREEEVITIPEAFLVRETIDVPFADVVESVERADHANMSSIKRRVCVLTLLVVALVAIALGSALYVTLGRNGPSPSAQPPGTSESGSDSFEAYLEPSYYPSSHPSLMSVQDHLETYVLQRNVTFDGMGALDSRKMALDWITKTDPLQLDVSDVNLHQRYVLALLVYECSEDNDLGWLSDNYECEWLGVTCKYGHVIKLELGMKELTGTIPPEIGRLEYLEVLDMRSNSLSGTIPPELGNLRNLNEILLHYNYKLAGSIPPDIGGLQLLTTIDLGFNKLTGTLPADLGNASALTAIYMMSNKITGPLPTEIGKLSELEVINLSYNDMSGTIPREMGNLNRLTLIFLESNSFSGPLPIEIGRLRSLEVISMHSNSLSETLPPELGHLKELTSLNFYNNALTGTLPTELGSLRLLTVLNLHQNQFYGTLPNELRNLTRLTYLALGVNQFTGTLPSWLGNLNVEILSVNDNHFNGSLPSELGLMNELALFWLHSNAMTGTLPPELGNLNNLTELLIQENDFNGTLPSELCNLAKLSKLAFDRNNFTGSLPSDIGNLHNLMELFAYTNKLTGPLPSEIGRLRNLQQLSVGRNILNGTLPPELGNLKDLYHLELDNNHFIGTLPTELEDLKNLTQLRLNGNQFTGPYLSGLRTCTTGMAVLCVESSNNFTGDLPKECDEVGSNCWDFTTL